VSEKFSVCFQSNILSVNSAILLGFTQLHVFFQVLEGDIRRLFDLSGDEHLILSTEIDSTSPGSNKRIRVDIDPIVWPTIRNQVAVIWVKSREKTTVADYPATPSHQAQGDSVERTTLNICVRTHWDRTIQLDVHGGDSIGRVKELLEERNIAKATRSPLYWGRILLEDHRPVSYYSIANGATLSCLSHSLPMYHSHK
jgi:hypothetical protein